MALNLLRSRVFNPFSISMSWYEVFIMLEAVLKDPDVRRQIVETAVRAQLEANPVYVTARSLLTLFEHHAHAGVSLPSSETNMRRHAQHQGVRA